MFIRHATWMGFSKHNLHHWHTQVVSKLPLPTEMLTLQQKVSLYTKWFHQVLSEFIGCSE